MYVGYSNEHSTTVGNILNLTTGHISPQYHVVYDELFTTVLGSLTDAVFDAEEWNALLQLKSLETYIDPPDAARDQLPFREWFDDFVQDPDPSTEPASPAHEGDASPVPEGDGGESQPRRSPRL